MIDLLHSYEIVLDSAKYCKHIMFGDVFFLAPLTVESICQIQYTAKCAFIKV